MLLRGLRTGTFATPTGGTGMRLQASARKVAETNTKGACSVPFAVAYSLRAESCG